jgi:hypothetical protein
MTWISQSHHASSPPREQYFKTHAHLLYILKGPKLEKSVTG